MRSNINTILIILSYLCTTAFSSKFGLEENASHKSTKSGHRDCYVKMPLLDTKFMPIPFEGNFSLTNEFIYESIRDLEIPFSNPKVIRPDKNGYLFFKHNNSYKMGCSENSFTSPSPYPYSELTVKCINGYFKYAGKMYDFDKFRCRATPRPKLLGTEINCQGKGYNEIKKIGFQSRDTFLNLYRICFDNELNHTLYVWYFVSSPIYEHNQISIMKPKFVNTRETCNIDVRAAYENLTTILEENLNAEDLDAYRKSNKKNRFIIPVHLISKHEFVYAAEQYATYFYENTAPQWLTLNNEVWKNFEKSFRRNLAKSNARHLIVAGVFYATSRLDIFYGLGQPENSLSCKLAVPEYFWKMDYDVDRKSGIVYIGVNCPYKKIGHTMYICDTMPCPASILSSTYKSAELFYCCSKESFEKMYGKLDPIVYKKF